MFTARDLVSGKMVEIWSIDFIGGEIEMVDIRTHDAVHEYRQKGEDLEIFLNGKPL